MSIKQDNQHSTYEITKDQDEKQKHVIAVLVDNEFGVLSRVIGLFFSRGYNIDSLTVSEVDHTKQLSRITIVTTGTQAITEQIMALLNRLIPVREVRDLSQDGPHIERTLALIKLINDNEDERDKAQHIANKFGARTVDSTATSLILELSDTPENVNSLIDQLTPLGIKEIARTGVTAIARGIEII